MRSLALLLAIAAGGVAQEPLHQICGACHTTVAEDFRSHPHLEQGFDCHVCHGQSQIHRDAAGAAPPDRVAAPHEVPALCGTCHIEQLAGFETSRHGVLTAAMERAPHCGTCHDVHRVRSSRAIERRCNNCHQNLPPACSEEPPPEIEAKVSCAACHRPHAFHADR